MCLLHRADFWIIFSTHCTKCLRHSYHRTISPCSRKFFRLGSVCCRSGVVSPCWYLSCKTREPHAVSLTPDNLPHCTCNLTRSVWWAGTAAFNSDTCAQSPCLQEIEILPTEEVYILSPWHSTILPFRLLLIWTPSGQSSLITGMCANM